MRITDVYQLDREYQQLRADFILGKVTSIEIVRQHTATAALLKTVPQRRQRTTAAATTNTKL